jgi:energy-coupling factor transport system substrate-specific component
MKQISSLLFISVNIAGIALFTWPFFLPIENSFFKTMTQASWLAIFLAFIATAILGAQISSRLLDSKSVAIAAVLIALIAALRMIGAGAVGIEPMWFLLILAARVFDRQLSFSIAMLGMIVSALLTGGIGPWLPFQVLAAGWVAIGVKLIPSRIRGRGEVFALAIYGAVAALLFGALMDLQLWPLLLGTDTQLSFQPADSAGQNLERFIAFHIATALAWDAPRAILTATLILITGRPIINSLKRAELRLSAVASWRIATAHAKEQKVVSQPR